MGLWVLLEVLSLLTPSAAYWQMALGVLTVFGAVIAILWAANKDGLGLLSITARSPLLLIII